MKEMCQVKRGEWLPLKIRSSATRDDILKAAVEKHTLFNKLFNPNVKYKLVFKDGSDASKIPGSAQRKVLHYPDTRLCLAFHMAKLSYSLFQRVPASNITLIE